MSREVLILGLGHIGASLASRLSSRGWKVAGWDRDRKAIRHCLARKWIRREFSPESESASICIVALPERSIHDAKVIRALAGLSRGTLVTDVFSSKGEAARLLADLCEGLELRYAWSHPLAGREGFGHQSADHAIFDGATVLVDKAAPIAIRVELAKLWKSAGCRVQVMDTRTHQRRMAAGSHLMHALAFAVVHSVRESEGLLPSVLGVTRVAKSKPDAWSEILLSNGKDVAAALSRLRKKLGEVENLIRKERKAPLLSYLQKAHQIRLRMEER